MQNRFENLKFENLQIIQLLAETHQATTKIYLCRFQQQLYICKAIQKQTLKNNAKGIEHIYNQKQALKYFTENKTNKHICQFYGTFQDQMCLYLMLEMVEGLPLHKLLQMMGKIKIQFVKLVITQIVYILRDFHNQGFIYRDIKSSNFMVNGKGIVKMIDLGKAKKIMKERTYTICGTAHAMAPQIHFKTGYSYQCDYYSLGVLIYELIVGSSPFGYGNSNKSISLDIENGLTYTILSKVLDNDAKDVIQNLMKKQPKQRLGAQGGFQQIIKHQFFDEFKQQATKIYNGELQLNEYDPRFYQQISEIIDFGLDYEKYEEITEDDPFFKFL